VSVAGAIFRGMKVFRRIPGRRAAGVWAAVVVAATVAWLHSGFGHEATAAQPAAPATGGQLADLLNRVTVVDHLDQATGYDRSCRKGHLCVFGAAWNDPTDHSGCDTRDRILSKQLDGIQYKPNTHECKVIAGHLIDPYTGQPVQLANITIDHLVPLHRAWNAGASKWGLQQRRIFANDPVELLAVSAQANEAKKDSGLDRWLPVYQPCSYVTKYLTVAAKYQLPITTTERNAAIHACTT
jgi:hypothetical protein